MGLTIRRLTEREHPAWDAYVARHSDGTFCHRAGWKTAVEGGAGQDCPFLFAERDGEVVGILPLVIRSSLLFGKAAISSMFGVYGGPLADDEDAYRALDGAAWDIARDAGCDSLEYRTRRARHAGDAGWHSLSGQSATFVRALDGADDEALLLSIPRKQRAVVRKSLKNNLVTDWQGDVALVWDLYARSVHGLGTPVFPRKLFETMAAAFEGNIWFQVTRDQDGSPVASLLSFYDEKTVLPFYAGSAEAARGLGAHDFMYFELMRKAVAHGIAAFDFGRSKIDSGPYRFKKNWGFDPTPLEYEIRLADGAQAPNLSPTNKKFQMMIAIWKRMPLWLANSLGPPLARHLG